MPIVNGRIERRRNWFSEQLRNLSFLFQTPQLVTFRELVLFAYTGYIIIYHGVYVTLGRIYDLLAVQMQRNICSPYEPMTGLGCLSEYLWRIYWMLLAWMYLFVSWGMVAGVAVLVGEEVLRWTAKARA